MKKEASNLRDWLLIRLLFRLGCRVSELLAVKISDIDFLNRTVTIQHLKTRVRLSCPNCKAWLARTDQFCPRCGDRVDEATKRLQQVRCVRILPIDLCTTGMLRNHLIGNHLRCDSSKRVFDLNRHRAWQIVRDCALRALLPHLVNPETGRARGISPHRLRDAFSVHAMKLDNSGDGLRILQEHVGHVSFNTTARYRKIAGEEHRRCYEPLNKTIYNVMSPQLSIKEGLHASRKMLASWDPCFLWQSSPLVTPIIVHAPHGTEKEMEHEGVARILR